MSLFAACNGSNSNEFTSTTISPPPKASLPSSPALDASRRWSTGQTSLLSHADGGTTTSKQTMSMDDWIIGFTTTTKRYIRKYCYLGQIPVSDNEYVVCIMLQDCAPQQTNILLQQLQLVARSNTNLANPPKWVFHGQLLPTGPNGKKSLEKPLSFQTRQSLQRPAMRCHADSQWFHVCCLQILQQNAENALQIR